MKNLIIRSVIDVITNSSSETFLIKRGTKTLKEIENDLLSHKSDKDRGTGMGGILEVKDRVWEDTEKIRSDLAIVDIDQGFKDLMKYLLKTYYVIDVMDSTAILGPDNERVISIGKSSSLTGARREGGEIVELISYYSDIKEQERILNGPNGEEELLKYFKWNETCGSKEDLLKQVRECIKKINNNPIVKKYAPTKES